MSHIISYHVFVNTKFCTMFTVCVSLSLAQSVPFYMIIICIELEHYAKLRHIAQFFDRIISKCCFYTSITKYFIGNMALCHRCSRHYISIRYHCRMFFYLKLRLMSAHINTITVIFVVQIHTCNLPLCITHLHQISTIVVDRCTPEVWLRNGLDHLTTCIFIRYQTTI